MDADHPENGVLIPCRNTYRPGGDFIALGHAKQPGGKTVHVWATEDDWNPEELKSNTFKMEWPPRSGKYQNFPELDRASWFQTEEARERILKGQSVFLDRLNEVLSASKSGDARAK